MIKNYLFIRNLGRISYPRFNDIKNGVFEGEKTNGDIKNTLLLVEHSSPLFTFPKKDIIEQSDALSEAMLSFSSKLQKNNDFNSFKKLSKLGFDVCTVEKRNNGILCWHGPGQLTVYPIFSNQYKIEEFTYKKKLENVVQKTLKDLQIDSIIKNDQIIINNNQIVGDIKIFNNEFKLPGFSLNINTNFGDFNEIKNLTSISKVTKSYSMSVSDIIPLVSNNFKKEFNFDVVNDFYSYYVSQLENQNSFAHKPSPLPTKITTTAPTSSLSNNLVKNQI
ncbi:hypothetical protein DICPUDRAFT_79660 [Dictyostelium purpureum]|uniref:BPL/LPL catalytic domain-containing protein n=1 Tax=Dictyostelium purpureum TaxID=5786 RepID=F0ZN88_DICPU|nr:uncharacterized protein DICPUDRAFT_79660 [Dictyostelium purpureum]EGC34597.1 hypothetical protein DICPUDRAFT_79660 [Dictyostelium purpureum]|eukprot:XP_003288874.1 hypothetical protein DICPUDRAFT_79660 [Dictyostelium purpureum]